MGYTALYRKFRPLVFSDVVGQEHITRTLRNQIVADKVGHAYLFTGSRGTGKTSSAKILARAINCLNPQDGEPCNECEICKAALNGSLTDIVEMDAASNNSVEDVRSIREEVNFLPTKAKYRVYIIDEVHMLSTGAFNALLKTLEEPPEHVKFILATTEPQKLPATILSRCQRFDFSRISNEDIVKRLKVVCKESKIDATDEALNLIATLAEGGMRDSLSILERCAQDGENKIDEDKAKDLVGIPKIAYVNGIVNSIIDYDIDSALKNVDNVLNSGKDLNNFVWEIIKYVKDVLVFKTTGKTEIYSKDEAQSIKDLANKTDKERLVKLIFDLSELQSNMKWSTQKTIMFQAKIIELCSEKNNFQTIQMNGYNLNQQINYTNNVDNLYNKNTINTVQINNKNNNNNLQNTNSLNTNYNNTTSNDFNNISNNTNLENSILNNGTEKDSNVKNLNEKQILTNANIPKENNKKYSNNLNKSWPKIVSDLKENGKIVLYTNLINTTASKVDDKTVEIRFINGISSFGKSVLGKQENINELTSLLSQACGNDIKIKYVEDTRKNIEQINPESDIQEFANSADIPFNIQE